jgi:hypothetical protein
MAQMARSALAVVSSHASDPVAAVDEVVREIGAQALAGAALLLAPL